MKILYKVFACILVILLHPLIAKGTSAGPLQVKNLYPIVLHTDQPYLEKAAMENSMSYSLSHSSTYTVQESGRWLINLDMEITELNFRYKRIIRDFAELNLDIPVLIVGSGFMDGFLGDYHDAFGLDDYGRSRRPDNDFLYEVRRDGDLIIKGESGVALGDVRIAVKKSLINSDTLILSIKGDIEIPLSDAKKGYSNGSLDAGISVLIDKPVSDRVVTYWNLGAIFPGDIKGHETLALNNYMFGGAAVDIKLKENLSFILQLQGQTDIYPETDLIAVDRNAYLLAVGGRYYRGKKSLEFSLTEDTSTSGAPDFILNLTYKLNL